MRAIDADAMLARLEEWNTSDSTDKVLYNFTLHRILEQPTIESERKTGRWLIREGISDAQCSECKMYFRDVYDMDNSDAFCRHCGAKMDGLKVVEDE